MKPHKHAEVLRAIADGVPLDEFEAEFISGMWRPLEQCAATNRGDACGWIESPNAWEIRRKPQYIMVNGFKVPKPLDIKPARRTDYYCPSFEAGCFYGSYRWENDYVDDRMLERRVIHLTIEAAIAHAKAMLGIDPEAK